MYYFLVLKVNMNKRFLNIWRQYRHLEAFHKIAIKAKAKFSQTYVGEGNGIPLQYSCLENPMDRGSW